MSRDHFAKNRKQLNNWRRVYVIIIKRCGMKDLKIFFWRKFHFVLGIIERDIDNQPYAPHNGYVIGRVRLPRRVSRSARPENPLSRGQVLPCKGLVKME